MTMKRICIPLCFLMAVACQDEPKSNITDTKADSSATTAPAPEKKPDSSAKFEGPVISERIDGPANIRSSVNGKVIFSLENNVPVSAREPKNGWLEIGVVTDIDNGKDIDGNLVFKKGTILYRDGKVIGKILEDTHIYEKISDNGKKEQAVLNGFTAANNIQPATILENSFAELAKNKTSLTLGEVRPFLDTYKFEDFNGFATGNSGYVFYESAALDPSARPRFWPIFKGNELVVIFHGRKMDIPGVKSEPFEGGYITIFTKDAAIVEKLKKDFIHFNQSAG